MFKKITLQRTPCFGACPVYKVEIDNKGRVRWIGEEYVEKPGSYEWFIPREKVEALNRAVNKFGYKSYKYKALDGYKTDFPSAITSVLFDDGYFRSIRHYLGETLEDNRLIELENYIDRIAGTENYINEERKRTAYQEVSSMFPCYLTRLASWAGKWDTNFGKMVLFQNGSYVFGNYTRDKGKVMGTVVGDKLIGRWSESPTYAPPYDVGDFELTLSFDGKNFRGVWRYGNSGAMTNSWSGMKIS